MSDITHEILTVTPVLQFDDCCPAMYVHHRAAKHATSDTVSHDHLVRLGHMFNRLGAHLSTLSQQQQRPWSPTRIQQRKWPGSAAADFCLWLPKKHASQEVRYGVCWGHPIVQ
jgi:hypothetical protein